MASSLQSLLTARNVLVGRESGCKMVERVQYLDSARVILGLARASFVLLTNVPIYEKLPKTLSLSVNHTARAKTGSCVDTISSDPWSIVVGTKQHNDWHPP